MTVSSQDGQNSTSEPNRPTSEVSEKARRRTFDAAYRRRIVEEADRCVGSGQVGELLRREGLYSSHLSKWRRQRSTGALAVLTPRSKKRGQTNDAVAEELERLRREKDQIAQRLGRRR